jgi:hypothetical protein
MNKDEERIKRLFPSYFQQFDLPKEAREEEITVYRACKSRKCDKESFTPSFEEQGCKYFEGDDPKDPGLYSLSTYEKPKDVKRFVKLTTEYGKPYKIAIGTTDPLYGLVQRTREREKGRKNSHVDWWLYKDAKPYISFKMIDDFETYLEEYKKKGGNI